MLQPPCQNTIPSHLSSSPPLFFFPPSPRFNFHHVVHLLSVHFLLRSSSLNHRASTLLALFSVHSAFVRLQITFVSSIPLDFDLKLLLLKFIVHQPFLCLWSTSTHIASFRFRFKHEFKRWKMIKKDKTLTDERTAKCFFNLEASDEKTIISCMRCFELR